MVEEIKLKKYNNMNLSLPTLVIQAIKIRHITISAHKSSGCVRFEGILLHWKLIDPHYQVVTTKRSLKYIP